MKRRICIALAFSLTVIGIGLVGAWALYSEIGRTPDELIGYAERRPQGHSRIEVVAQPILRILRVWFGESGYGDRQLPFVVPALPANPASTKEIVRPLQDMEGIAQAGKQPADGDIRIIRVGPTRDTKNIAMGARLAKDGDIIEIDAGDYHADVAALARAQLTIRGVGGRARLFASGANAEGKAIWVIRGGKITVENIDFIGARAEDGNGAGIRFETGHLIVRNCLFFNNETGLLATGGDAQIEIENSEFGYNGTGDGQTHNLYVGNVKSLKVTGSYFHHANVGHLIKSRAAKNYISYNRLTDEIGGRASYELEFPNGGVAYVIGNIIQQTAQTSNSTLISFGAEGYAWPINELYLVNNTLVNDHPGGGAFLRVVPGAQYVKTQNNLLVGKGKFHTPDILNSTGDIRADWGIFARAVRQDYRLNAEGRRHTATPAGIVKGVDLTPDSEYVHPLQVKKLTAPPIYPGAIQTPAPP